MKATFDAAGDCARPATKGIEGYSPTDSGLHGSLDVMVFVCDTCHPKVRARLHACAMTPFTVKADGGMTCGQRVVFEANRYVERYPAIEGSPSGPRL